MSNTASSTKAASETGAAFVATPANTDILPFADMVDKYRNADKKGKAAIRANLVKRIESSIMDGNDELAKRLIVTKNALTPANAVKEVDHGQIVANALFVTISLFATIRTYADENDVTVKWDNTDVPDISELMDIPDGTDFSGLSDKIGKVGKSLLRVKSDRKDIQGVFDRAFHNSDIGDVLVVADIARNGALPDYAPGSGAIAARLANRVDGHMELKTDDCTLVGYEPIWADKSGNVATSPTCPVGMVQAARKTANRDNSDIEDDTDNSDS